MSGTAGAVRVYEKEFADYFGVRSAHSFWKGRVALYAILRVLGIKAGDEVILPGFTCIVVPNAVRYCGATPVFADIDAATFNLDPGCFERAITARTRAVVIQHTFGVPADMESLLTIARKHDLAVVEDCAHALDSKYDGRSVGTFGDAAFFSFQWSKPYSTGLGGMAITNDESLSSRLVELQSGFVRPDPTEIRKLALQVSVHKRFFSSNIYWSSMQALHLLSRLGLFVGSSNRQELESEMPDDYRKRMSVFQAKVGLERFRTVRTNTARRMAIVERYQRSLSERGWSVQPCSSRATPVFVRYPILVEDKRKALNDAERNHFELGSWFESVLHPAGSPLEKSNYHAGQCPVAECVAQHVVNLPTHTRVSEGDIERSLALLLTSNAPYRVDSYIIKSSEEI